MTSELQTYQSNLDTVSGTLSRTLSVVNTGITALSIAEKALKAPREIDTKATTLESIASGLETGLALVARISGTVGPVANALKRTIDLVEDRARDLREAAEAAQPPERSTASSRSSTASIS